MSTEGRAVSSSNSSTKVVPSYYWHGFFVGFGLTVFFVFPLLYLRQPIVSILGLYLVTMLGLNPLVAAFCMKKRHGNFKGVGKYFLGSATMAALILLGLVCLLLLLYLLAAFFVGCPEC